MFLSRPRPIPGRLRRGLAGVATLALTTTALTACDSTGGGPDETGPGVAGSPGSTGSAPAAAGGDPVVAVNVRRGAQGVAVDKLVEVRATDARLRSVEVSAGSLTVPGEIDGEGTTWTATGRLEPGTSYQVRTVAEDAEGREITRTSRFSTRDLSLDEQTYASVAPLQGETVGVGMPVIVTFDVPVTDRASIEEHLRVESRPRQPGTWHWLSDTEVHWRPRTYWQAGTDVSVDVDINSVPAGGGIYGQESRRIDFSVGDANIYRVDARSHRMRVLQNGELLRTLPVTTGKPGFTTRSGVKVIVEKFESKRMNSETVGIAAGSAESYDIEGVQWAMRLTYSGEFIHAAPWSVADQGRANVSHGCTGLSTADAGWLYAMSKRGDVVEYTGTDRPMTLENGYGDWNASWAEYREGSARS